LKNYLKRYKTFRFKGDTKFHIFLISDFLWQNLTNLMQEVYPRILLVEYGIKPSFAVLVNGTKWNLDKLIKNSLLIFLPRCHHFVWTNWTSSSLLFCNCCRCVFIEWQKGFYFYHFWSFQKFWIRLFFIQWIHPSRAKRAESGWSLDISICFASW